MWIIIFALATIAPEKVKICLVRPKQIVSYFLKYAWDTDRRLKQNVQKILECKDILQ
jgi:hypothetical protein